MEPKVSDIIEAIELLAPLSVQESWDNSGLQVGDPNALVKAALITIDVTEAIIDEALALGCGLIIAHHPLIFSGLKRLTGKSDVERAVIKAVQNNIAVYSAHTNIDLVSEGVSHKMAQKLGLNDIKVLTPQGGLLKKLVVFVPHEQAEIVRKTLFEAGAGHISDYDACSFNLTGTGTFRGAPTAHPFAGQPGILHSEPETRIETIFPAALQNQILKAMLKVHPYEEPAYDLYPLDNLHPKIGLGVIAKTPEPVDPLTFLNQVKTCFNCPAIKYTSPHKPVISTVALCGGSGSSLIRQAKAAGADLFITGDIKYHQFFEAENQMILADIGHFESEQFTKELFFEIVTNKFPKFALRLSKVQTNPVNYLF